MAKNNEEPDSTFFLKILVFFILGTVWVRADSISLFGLINAFPVGLILGLVFASHDHFVIDRKLEYVVLIISTIISFFLPIGLVI